MASEAGKAMTGFYTTVNMRAAGLEYGFRLAPALYRRLADRIEAAAKGA
jgi:hypothetical protein